MAANQRYCCIFPSVTLYNSSLGLFPRPNGFAVFSPSTVRTLPSTLTPFLELQEVQVLKLTPAITDSPSTNDARSPPSPVIYLGWRFTDVVPMEYDLRLDTAYQHTNKEILTQQNTQASPFITYSPKEVIRNQIPFVLLSLPFFNTLGLPLGCSVQLDVLPKSSVPTISVATLRPFSSEDLHLLEGNASIIEDAFLKQLAVVYRRQKIPVILPDQPSTIVHVHVDCLTAANNEATIEFGLLQPNALLAIDRRLAVNDPNRCFTTSLTRKLLVVMATGLELLTSDAPTGLLPS